MKCQYKHQCSQKENSNFLNVESEREESEDKSEEDESYLSMIETDEN